jgi:hypothetical protein
MIEFSSKTKHRAFSRSGGHCECTRQKHGHPGRCDTEVTINSATYHPFSVVGSDDLLNCEVLCPACLEMVDAHQLATTRTP